MFTVSEEKKWLKLACGDAVKFNYIKKIYTWVQGFGPSRKFFVKADVDGGAKGDEPVIVDIFDNKDDAQNLIDKLIGDDYIG